MDMNTNAFKINHEVTVMIPKYFWLNLKFWTLVFMSPPKIHSFYFWTATYNEISWNKMLSAMCLPNHCVFYDSMIPCWTLMKTYSKKAMFLGFSSKSNPMGTIAVPNFLCSYSQHREKGLSFSHPTYLVKRLQIFVSFLFC